VAGGPPPCGESGCTLFHHPALHVQRTGWTGIHGAVYTTFKEDGKKHNMVITRDNSREPEEGRIKQGTGELRSCGPSTFFNVDSFVKHGENVPGWPVLLSILSNKMKLKLKKMLNVLRMFIKMKKNPFRLI
jgi:hypothetical protein